MQHDNSRRRRDNRDSQNSRYGDSRRSRGLHSDSAPQRSAGREPYRQQSRSRSSFGQAERRSSSAQSARRSSYDRMDSRGSAERSSRRASYEQASTHYPSQLQARVRSDASSYDRSRYTRRSTQGAAPRSSRRSPGGRTPISYGGNTRGFSQLAGNGGLFRIGLIAALAIVLALIIFFVVRGCTAGPSDESANSSSAAGPVSSSIVMTLEGDKDTMVLKGEEYLEPGCKATDKASGTITTDMQIDGKVDTSTVGDYEITYTATMPDGSRGQATRTVHVVDSFEENATSLPVLMYHYVYTADDAEGKTDANYLLDTKLRKQLEYLKANDYYYPSYQEIRGFAEGTHTLPARSVVLTFDDGEEGFLKYGVPLFNEFEIPATSFVVCTDAGNKLVEYATEYVQFQSHTFNMHRDGSDIGQGGVIHAMTQEEIYADILQSAEVLGGEVQAVAYPYGDNNETAWAALEDAGVICAFTVKNARIHPGDNPMALNRVRIAGSYEQEGFEYLVAPNTED